MEFLENSKVIHNKDVFEVIELDGSLLTFKWMPVDDFINLEFYPTFIKDNINDLPQTTKHIIDHEEQV